MYLAYPLLIAHVDATIAVLITFISPMKFGDHEWVCLTGEHQLDDARKAEKAENPIAGFRPDTRGHY